MSFVLVKVLIEGELDALVGDEVELMGQMVLILGIR